MRIFDNSGRDLHRQGNIVIKQNAVRRNQQNVCVRSRVQNHVLGRVGMITNGKLEDHHQKPGNAVIQKISLS